MSVDVNQAGRDHVAAHLDHDPCMSGRKIGSHAHDVLPHHRNVKMAVPMIGGINHASVLQQQIINLLAVQRRTRERQGGKLHGADLHTGNVRPSRSYTTCPSRIVITHSRRCVPSFFAGHESLKANTPLSFSSTATSAN